jgi:drug/metabolite transporter (DMT)-like permease
LRRLREAYMRESKYEGLLAAVIAARATSFLFNKLVLASMDTFNLLAIRFLMGFFLLLVLFSRRLRHIRKEEILAGACVGLLFFLTLSSELTALKTTASSTVSLLENCSILFVPLFEAALRRKLPDRKSMLCACIALLGVFCLTAQAGAVTVGMLFGLLAAMLYAAAILLTDRVSHRDTDALRIGIVQVGVMGALALCASFLFETPHLPTDGRQWMYIVILAVVCTGFGFTLQPVAQSRVSAQSAGLLCAISPAVATLLGTVVLHEQFGVLSAVGLLLILASIVLPHVRLLRSRAAS